MEATQVSKCYVQLKACLVAISVTICGNIYMYRIMPSVGQTKELSAKNCKEIKEELSTDCGTSPQNGVLLGTWSKGS